MPFNHFFLWSFFLLPFSPKIQQSDVYCTPITYYLLFLHGSNHHSIATHPLPYLTNIFPGRWKRKFCSHCVTQCCCPSHGNMGTIKYLSSLLQAFHDFKKIVISNSTFDYTFIIVSLSDVLWIVHLTLEWLCNNQS